MERGDGGKVRAKTGGGLYGTEIEEKQRRQGGAVRGIKTNQSGQKRGKTQRVSLESEGKPQRKDDLCKQLERQ